MRAVLCVPDQARAQSSPSLTHRQKQVQRLRELVLDSLLYRNEIESPREEVQNPVVKPFIPVEN